ncbi:hypothetical protein TSAR_015617 [Trichomalopsis sarcophagae]|uniref:Uncharacterized protein n=1 Tax=Trichomalopsis sarcophagae TaxID=543379 RepID=A0A232EP16_9HYME|nr:hypothetical protein TSAR_015617 [Trichomalopsis sarcophagae]
MLSGTPGVTNLTRQRRSQRWLPGTERNSITRGNSTNAAQQKPWVAVISAEPSYLLLVTAPGGFASSSGIREDPRAIATRPPLTVAHPRRASRSQKYS